MSKKPKGLTSGEDQGDAEVTNSRTLIIDSGKIESLRSHLEKLESRGIREEIIKEAVIVDGSKLNVKWVVQVNNGSDTTTKKCSAPVHDDLRAAFHRLSDHLARLCFQPLTEPNPVYKTDKTAPKLIAPVSCVGFKISGSDETESVILFGDRSLPNAKSIDLQSPPQRWNGDIFDYEHSDDLSEIIAACIGEVELYLFEDKHQPDNQLSLFPEEEGVEEEENELTK